MGRAGVADVDGPLLYRMAGLAIGWASVNGVLVIEASASRVELCELITHGKMVRRR